ncbi:Nuclear transport factor 2 [Perkinsus olseni]|uniref:Nuclear transport factor 2 n=1 Tax=Perkinsus olseni TaxID=32597 RepID=A0A7J6LHD3_PEROL|nr:Nuclear transport factor 2 [Perkinsus olseni]KAF4658708.1 Nuclear transport factor 2 [Perkinsus olseni]
MAQINPQFQSIGEQFVQHYYGTFDANRSNLTPLYGDTSMLTFEGEQFQGATNIVQKLVSLPFLKVQHQVIKADCQPNPSNNGVVVFVTGNLMVDDNQNPLKFGQVFHLAPSPSGGIYCLNDMFRLNIG